jgi:hypothetical protein
VPSYWHEGGSWCSVVRLCFYEGVLEGCWDISAEALASDRASERFGCEGSCGRHCAVSCVFC